MSFAGKLGSIVTALICVSCASGTPLPQIATPPQRIVQKGYSFIPLDEKGWYIIGRNEYQVVLGKYGEHPDERFALQAQPVDCPPFDTEEEFVRLIREEQSQNINSARFKVVSNEATPYPAGGATCVKSHLVTEDHAAVKRSSRSEPMVRDVYSLTCRHPRDASIGILLTLSQRGYRGQGDPQFADKASLLFNSIQFDAL